MGKIYTNPFDWGYADDNTLIYVDTSEDGIKSMINQALDDALDDVKDEIVDETMSSMDIKLEGENLLYKLIVNGNENGEINIPKDQFLKSTTYDSENKKLIFVMETADGETTTEVSISDLVASIEEKNQEQDNVLAEKADKTELETFATKEEVQAVDAKVEAIEVPDVSGLATKEEVEAVDNKVETLEIPSIEGLASETWVEEQGYLKEHQDISALATKAEVEAVNAKVEAIEIPSIEGLAKSADVTAEIAAAVEPLATKSEIADKANVSQIPTRTSELVNDSNFITSHQSLEEYAKKTFVGEEIAKVVGGAPETLDTLKEIADALQDNATMTMVSEAIATKANAEDVYNKTEVYNKQESDELFQASGDYVPVEDYNALVQKVAALENYVNIFIKDREEKMDEIINNMDADNKEVVIETPMESIVVPETTVAYTITAPLADNSTVELTSPKYMTLFNTSEEPVSTSIGHTFVEGESTSATSVYLVGDFDTLTLENVSPAVKSGYDAASVNNVVISENNVKNLTLALDIQDGATITNNSNANITIQDKNDMATTLTIVAPNSTVTLNGSNYEVVNAAVSDDTLIIKKNVSHIGTLNVSKGNVIVEVARQSLIAEKIDKYTLADGYTIDYLHDEIDSTNVSNLAKEGTHTLVDDVTKSGNFSVGMFSTDDIIWDLNGHSITSSNTRGYGIFRLRGSAHLEINDSVGGGIVKNTDDDYGLWTGTADSKVVINGGHFEASTHVLYAEKGTIEINGGSFRLTNEDTADKDQFGNFKFLVNCHDADYTSGEAKIIIRGGKFYGWNPSASYGEPSGPVSFVAEGYGVVESTEMIDGVEHKVFEVKPINE